MGGGKGRQDQPTLSQVPDSTCKVEDRVRKLQLKIQVGFVKVSKKVSYFSTQVCKSEYITLQQKKE